MHRGIPIAIALLLPAFAHADNPVNWLIVEQVNRTDTTKTWNSPTAIDLGKMVWEYQYEITKLTGTVNIPLVGDVTEDITDSIDPAVRSSSGETRSLPAVLVNQSIVEPTTGTSADVFVEIDAQGYGRAVFSNIMLGSVDVPLFGSRPIQRINVEATVNVVGYDFGDYNRDHQVNAADFDVWRSTFYQLGPSQPADGNGDEIVDAADYVLWRANLADVGSAGLAGRGAGQATAIPEPATAALLLFLPLAFAKNWRKRRPLSSATLSHVKLLVGKGY